MLNDIFPLLHRLIVEFTVLVLLAMECCEIVKNKRRRRRAKVKDKDSK
jgi:hypothetical protein